MVVSLFLLVGCVCLFVVFLCFFFSPKIIFDLLIIREGKGD